jgi:hypothetical protein
MVIIIIIKVEAIIIKVAEMLAGEEKKFRIPHK